MSEINSKLELNKQNINIFPHDSCKMTIFDFLRSSKQRTRLPKLVPFIYCAAFYVRTLPGGRFEFMNACMLGTFICLAIMCVRVSLARSERRKEISAAEEVRKSVSPLQNPQGGFYVNLQTALDASIPFLGVGALGRERLASSKETPA